VYADDLNLIPSLSLEQPCTELYS